MVRRRADPILAVTIDDDTRTFSRDALLARPDVTDIDIPADIEREVRGEAIERAPTPTPFDLDASRLHRDPREHLQRHGIVYGLNRQGSLP